MSNPDPATRSLIWSDEWPASNGPSLRQGEETDDVLALSESLVLVRSSESSQLDAVNLVTGSWSPLDTFLSPYVPLRAHLDRSTGLLAYRAADGRVLQLLAPTTAHKHHGRVASTGEFNVAEMAAPEIGAVAHGTDLCARAGLPVSFAKVSSGSPFFRR